MPEPESCLHSSALSLPSSRFDLSCAPRFALGARAQHDDISRLSAPRRRRPSLRAACVCACRFASRASLTLLRRTVNFAPPAAPQPSAGGVLHVPVPSASAPWVLERPAASSAEGAAQQGAAWRGERAPAKETDWVATWDEERQVSAEACWTRQRAVPSGHRVAIPRHWLLHRSARPRADALCPLHRPICWRRCRPPTRCGMTVRTPRSPHRRARCLPILLRRRRPPLLRQQAARGRAAQPQAATAPAAAAAARR